jgi:hypothetical protein
LEETKPQKDRGLISHRNENEIVSEETKPPKKLGTQYMVEAKIKSFQKKRRPQNARGSTSRGSENPRILQ